MRTTEISVVHCARCNFASTDISLVTCQCGEVLGETVVTSRRGSWLPVIVHWAIVAAVAALIVAVAL